MPQRPTTNSRGDATRDRIRAAAVRCLVEDGLDGVRIARVARTAGVSSALVHYHFDTREALLEAAMETAFAIAGEARAAKYGAGTAVERLRRKLEESLPVEPRRRREWELWVELWHSAVREPALRSTAADVYRELHESWTTLIEEGAAAGELTVADPGRVADAVLATIDGLGLRMLLEDPAVDHERAVDLAWSRLADDLGIPPA